MQCIELSVYTELSLKLERENTFFSQKTCEMCLVWSYSLNNDSIFRVCQMKKYLNLPPVYDFSLRINFQLFNSFFGQKVILIPTLVLSWKRWTGMMRSSPPCFKFFDRVVYKFRRITCMSLQMTVSCFGFHFASQIQFFCSV